MYCVKCGVRLQDGAGSCPLCGTPAWDPDNREKAVPAFPSNMPPSPGSFRETAAFVLTVLTMAACFAMLLVEKNVQSSTAWAGYAILGTIVLFIAAVLPLWFRKPCPMVFIPLSHAAAMMYLLFICRKTGGHWFLTFAFPVALINCILITSLTALLIYVKGGRYFIFGGSIILLGGFTVLIELFEHIAFDLPMFRWSAYSAGACLAVGVFLLCAGIIKPLKHFLERIFFM